MHTLTTGTSRRPAAQGGQRQDEQAPGAEGTQPPTATHPPTRPLVQEGEGGGLEAPQPKGMGLVIGKCPAYTPIHTPLVQEGEGGGKEAPQPKGERVKIGKFPEWTAHVRSFDGFPSSKRRAYHYVYYLYLLKASG